MPLLNIPAGGGTIIGTLVLESKSRVHPLTTVYPPPPLTLLLRIYPATRVFYFIITDSCTCCLSPSLALTHTGLLMKWPRQSRCEDYLKTHLLLSLSNERSRALQTHEVYKARGWPVLPSLPQPHLLSSQRSCIALPLSCSVIPMVPPVLMTSTRASAADGDASCCCCCSTLSSELQLDNFLRRDGCMESRAGKPSLDASLRSICGCDRARARDVRL